ncbi:MAG: hypothetical protein N2745_07330, partial [Syntrophorhabdaceae bacterium]|nr:hypothetical protein [Syntrophorhabdaceae bacterium]
PASNLSKYLTGLQAADPAAYTAFKATLDSIVARGSNSALSSLANLATSVETDPNGTNAVSAVQTVLKDAQTNYATMMETMLATLHPGYYATVKHVGNQVYVTTLHKKQ